MGPVVVRCDAPFAMEVLRLGVRLEPGLNEIHDPQVAAALVTAGLAVLADGTEDEEEAKG